VNQLDTFIYLRRLSTPYIKDGRYVREYQFKGPFSLYNIHGLSQKHSQEWLFPALLP